MTTTEELTAAQVLEQMRADAEMMETVAEIIGLNRQAAVALTKRVSPACPSDQAAAQLVSIFCRVLLAFAGDMRDAIARTESGERKVHVVDMSDDSTKH